MRPYGLPRLNDVEFPDKADMRHYGLTDPLSEHGPRDKRRTRRLWRKLARTQHKRELALAIEPE